MPTPEQYEQAHKVAAEFNATVGADLLCVAARPAEWVTPAELRALARTAPGDYLASNAYLAIKGRKPSHGEVVKLGHLLGFLTVARRKDGPCTLWRLDSAFAQRAH